MTPIYPSTSHHYALDETQQNKIEHHTAWKGILSQEDAENLLKNQKPFTFLIRQEPAQVDNSCLKYFVSFVNQKSEIEHLFCTFNPGKQIFFYQNLIGYNATSIEELIPCMLHCEKAYCQPFNEKSPI